MVKNSGLQCFLLQIHLMENKTRQILLLVKQIEQTKQNNLLHKVQWKWITLQQYLYFHIITKQVMQKAIQELNKEIGVYLALNYICHGMVII